MPKITQTRYSAPQIGGKIGNVSPGQGQKAMAQAVSQASDVMNSMGKEFFEQAQETLLNNQYSKATGEATKMFNAKFQERINKRVDDEGNPTFDTLASDIDKIAEEVASESSKYIFNPQVSQRFSQDFSRFTNSKQIQAQKEARNQFLDYSKATLNQSTRALIDQAITDDPMNANSYIGKVDQLLLDAAAGGIISQQEAFQYKNAASSEVRVSLFSNSIDANPVATLAQLQKPHTTLGITERERDGLIRQAEAGIRDQEIARNKQIALMESKAREQKSLTTTELEFGIMNDQITSKDVIEATNSGQITTAQRNKLIKQINSKDRKEHSWNQVSAAIDQQVENSGYMGGFTPKQIDKHYMQSMETLKKDSIDPMMVLQDPTSGGSVEPGLQEKAKHVGSKYTVPVAAFNKELADAITRPGNEDAAMQSFAYLQSTNPAALGKLDKDSMAVASAALNLVTGTGVNPKQALAKAREMVIGTTDEVTKQRMAEFSRLPDVRETASSGGKVTSPIDTLIKDTFDVPGGKSLEPGMRNMFKTVLRDGYSRTGNLEDAQAYALSVMGPIVGVTEVTEEKGFFDDEERFMMYPPEKLFPDVPVAEMRADLIADARTQYPEVEGDEVRIRSDYLTTTANPTYAMYVLIDGIETPLYGDDNLPMRWSPDVAGIQERQEQRRQEAMDEATQEARQEREDIPQTLAEQLGTGAKGGVITQRRTRAVKALRGKE